MVQTCLSSRTSLRFLFIGVGSVCQNPHPLASEPSPVVWQRDESGPPFEGFPAWVPHYWVHHVHVDIARALLHLAQSHRGGGGSPQHDAHLVSKIGRGVARRVPTTILPC